MAAAERDGVRAAGLQAPLDDYAATTDRLISVAGPLAEQLRAVLTVIDQVRDGALARIADAGQQMAAAIDRAESAERAAQQAHAEQHRAARAAETAQAAARQAEEHMLAARHDAQTQIAVAMDRVALLEREHGQALARAQAADESRRDLEQRREAAERRAHELQREADRLAKTVEATREALDTSRHEGQVVRERAYAAEADRNATITQVETLQARAVDLAEQRAAALTRADAAEQAREDARDENTALTRHLTEAHAAAAAADARADSADLRYTQLVEALSDPERRSAPAKGPSA